MRSSLIVLSMTALALVATGCSNGDSTTATGAGGQAGSTAGGAGGQAAGAGGQAAGAGGSAAGAGGQAAGAGGSAAGAGGTAAGAGGQATGGAAGQGGAGGSAGGGAGGAKAGTGGTAQGGAGAAGAGAAGAGAAGAGAGGEGGTAQGGAGAGGSGQGGAAGNPGGAFFCPETSPFSPTLANSVVIEDSITQKDEHWTADKIYLIGHDFAVEEHTLTIDAGTVICLFQQGNISVGGVNPGEIHINGTADKHVTITAPPSADDATKPYNFHGGLSVNQWMNSTIANLDIWYGGPGGGGAAWAFQLPVTSGGADPTKPLLLDHLTVGQSQTRGIEIGTPLGIDPASSVHLMGYAPVDPNGPALGAVLDAEIRALTTLTKANLTIDQDGIPAGSRLVKIETNITPGNLDRPADLWDLGAPYQYNGNLGIYDDSGFYHPMWTIHEGVTLGLTGTIVIGDGPGNAPGDIVIAGTQASPVTITSASATPMPGDWGGIKFLTYLFDPMISKIEGAQLLYGGNQFSDSYVTRCDQKPAGVIAIEGQGSYVGPAINHCTIAHSATDGIVTHASDAFGDTCTTDYSMSTLTFMDNAGASLAIGPCQ